MYIIKLISMPTLNLSESNTIVYIRILSITVNYRIGNFVFHFAELALFMHLCVHVSVHVFANVWWVRAHQFTIAI